MRVGSLFAGIGGFDLAAERAGMEIAWQSENDSKASAVLAHHWPEVPNYGDIHNMGVESADIGRQYALSGDRADLGPVLDATSVSDGGTNDRTALPGVDVLTGGFPCQDYSVAGNRGGLAGDRGALWWEYHRLITELHPTWVVGENVPGLLSSRDGADFETIVGSLTECGYGVAWAVLDAQYFGVAQRRRRVFIVGHSGGLPRPEVLALGEGLFGHPEPRRETGEATAPTLAARTRGGGWPGSDEAIDGALAFMWQAGGNNSASGAWEHEHTPTLPVGQTIAVAATLTQGAPTAGRRNEDDVNLVAFNPYRTLEKDGSITSGFAPRPVVDALHGPTGNKEPLLADRAQVRRLTPLECERLQGFPDHWTDIPGNSDTQRYRQLGNAVAVPVVEWLLRRIAT